MTTTSTAEHFDRQYQTHLKHLKLKGLQPKTIEAYSRAIRRLGGYFSNRIDDLSEAQLTDYFTDLVAPGLIKPPRTQRLPDIVTVEEARRLFAATRVVSYRVFYFTLYSLGEGPRLQFGNSSATRFYAFQIQKK